MLPVLGRVKTSFTACASWTATLYGNTYDQPATLRTVVCCVPPPPPSEGKSLSDAKLGAEVLAVLLLWLDTGVGSGVAMVLGDNASAASRSVLSSAVANECLSCGKFGCRGDGGSWAS